MTLDEEIKELRKEIKLLSASINFNRSAIRSMFQYVIKHEADLTRKAGSQIQKDWIKTFVAVYEEELDKIRADNPELAQDLDLRKVEPELFQVNDGD